MEIRKYKKFLKEDVGGDDAYQDEFNRLSDGYDDYDDDYDGNRFPDDDYYNKENEGPEVEGTMEELIDLFKQMFYRSKIEELEIEGDLNKIKMYFELNQKEKLKDILSIFETLNKIRKDILPQYDCDMDLWKYKDGTPLLSIIFTYAEDDITPF